VYTKLGVSVGSDSYRNAIIDREDDIYSASAQVGYQFRRWVKVYAGYSWDQKDSKIDNLDYTDHTFLVGLELSL
jgi:predicted porin